MRKVSEILTEGLERLGPNGEHWCKGYFHREDKYCMLGSIGFHTATASTIGDLRDAQRFLLKAIREKLGEGWTVPVFNDHLAKNFMQVKEVFCTAIKEALTHEEG